MRELRLRFSSALYSAGRMRACANTASMNSNAWAIVLKDEKFLAC